MKKICNLELFSHPDYQWSVSGFSEALKLPTIPAVDTAPSGRKDVVALVVKEEQGRYGNFQEDQKAKGSTKKLWQPRSDQGQTEMNKQSTEQTKQGGGDHRQGKALNKRINQHGNKQKNQRNQSP